MAQDLSKQPFINGYQSSYFENPAIVGVNHDKSISLLNTFNFGVYSPIRTFYGGGHLAVNKPEGRGLKLMAGLQFYNDREGTLINRTRGYGVVSAHVPLENDLWFSFGLSGGFAGYFEKGNAQLPAIGDVQPDGITGINLYNDNFRLGIALHQVLNNDLQPLDVPFSLRRYLHTQASYTFKAGLNHDILIENYNQLLPGRESVFNLLAGYEYDKLIKLGLGHRWNEGYYLLVNLAGEINEQSNFNLSFAYFFPLPSSNRIQVNLLEAQLGVGF